MNDLAVCHSKWLGQYNSPVVMCDAKHLDHASLHLYKLNICMRRWRFIVFNWIPSWWFYTQGNGMICIYLFILSVQIYIFNERTSFIWAKNATLILSLQSLWFFSLSLSIHFNWDENDKTKTSIDTDRHSEKCTHNETHIPWKYIFKIYISLCGT